MIKPEQIPGEAMEAAKQAVIKAAGGDLGERDSEWLARAACLAMLRAWPGMTTDGRELHFSTARGAPVTTVKAYSIILPLPTEKETSA